MIWATLVLAQSVPADVGGGLLGGAGGALVGGAGIWWLIRHHADQMEKARVSFAGEMKDARDDFSGKIDVLTEKFESAIRNLGHAVAYLDAPDFKKFWDADAKRVTDAVRAIVKIC